MNLLGPLGGCLCSPVAEEGPGAPAPAASGPAEAVAAEVHFAAALGAWLGEAAVGQTDRGPQDARGGFWGGLDHPKRPAGTFGDPSPPVGSLFRDKLLGQLVPQARAPDSPPAGGGEPAGAPDRAEGAVHTEETRAPVPKAGARQGSAGSELPWVCPEMCAAEALPAQEGSLGEDAPEVGPGAVLPPRREDEEPQAVPWLRQHFGPDVSVAHMATSAPGVAELEQPPTTEGPERGAPVPWAEDASPVNGSGTRDERPAGLSVKAVAGECSPGKDCGPAPPDGEESRAAAFLEPGPFFPPGIPDRPAAGRPTAPRKTEAPQAGAVPLRDRGDELSSSQGVRVEPAQSLDVGEAGGLPVPRTGGEEAGLRADPELVRTALESVGLASPQERLPRTGAEARPAPDVSTWLSGKATPARGPATVEAVELQGGDREPSEPRAEKRPWVSEVGWPQGAESPSPWSTPPRPDHHGSAHPSPGEPAEPAGRVATPESPGPYALPQRLRVEVPDVRGDPVHVEVRARSERVWVRVEGGPEVVQVLRGHAEGLQQALGDHGLSLMGLEVDTAGGRRQEPDAPDPLTPPPRPPRRWEAVRPAEGAVDYVV